MVGIVILNYNNSAQTLQCVDSLCRHCGDAGWKLCIVDNASREEEFAKLSALDHRATVLRSAVNEGYARGNNLGCEYFANDEQVDKILILNDDTRFTMDIITPLAAYLDAHPECGVTFPKVVAPDGSLDKACWRVQKSRLDLVMQATSLPRRIGIRRREFLPAAEFPLCGSVTGYGPSRLPLVPPGSCMMLRKSQFASLGWLDPHTFLYFEEHILLNRLRGEGFGSVLLSDANIVHLGAATTGKQPSKAIYRHWRQSYLYFIENFTDMPRFLRLYLRFRTWLRAL